MLMLQVLSSDSSHGANTLIFAEFHGQWCAKFVVCSVQKQHLKLVFTSYTYEQPVGELEGNPYVTDLTL
jgi:hypothetical protein